MNERIKQLEDQCWVKVPCDFDMRKGGLSTINTVFDRKKFAELIVRECADVAFDEYAATNGAASGESAILKHFGVEE